VNGTMLSSMRKAGEYFGEGVALYQGPIGECPPNRVKSRNEVETRSADDFGL
jgi:hypothetical protein